MRVGLADSAHPTANDMRVNVKLFAAARELAGGESIEVDLPAGATVARLRQELMERLPGVRELLTRSLFAIDCDYAADDKGLEASTEIACIPPVSGG
ncbi:MAG TPA: MoaD/ThiS family protein [Pirellulales bacterium]|jgi:molybdopterin synthase sulfur carrier subunit|nr:MoaD/ThiS family protein [Pirellulales bacterium]